MTDPLLAADRERGALLGLAVGELLATPAQNLTPDAIMRAFGRLVHVRGDVLPGPLTALAVSLASGHEAPPERALAAVPFCVATKRTIADDGAAQVIAALTHLALASDPFDRLPPRASIDRVVAIAGATVLVRLRDHSRAPLPPLHAANLFDDHEPPLRLVLEVAASLLARPRSSESQIVYATALGGDAILRAALTAAIAGVHRGAAALPERWCARVPKELARA